eukprot:TRINITY_DN27679_c0_g1_i2.p1 TRINITY_DN27679_c0_g1~~TRINITY_DN27679_c0_g1_i2.p1  ORF type:complete len:548 (+),score=97.43 TRINITY_DN27679_c0_g1_i2:46-1644(+)
MDRFASFALALPSRRSLWPLLVLLPLSSCLRLAWRRCKAYCKGHFRTEEGLLIPSLSWYGFFKRVWSQARSSERKLADTLSAFVELGELYATPTGIMLNSAELVDVVMRGNWSKIGEDSSTLYRSVLYRRLLGKSLVAVKESQWKKQRKVMSPAFSQKQLERLFAHVFKPVIVALVDDISLSSQRESTRSDQRMQSSQINVFDLMSRVTIDVIGRAAFSCDLGALSGDAKYKDARSAYVEALGLAANPLHFFFPAYQWFPTAGNRLLQHHLRAIDEMVAKILEDKRVALAQTEATTDLLDMVLAATNAEDFGETSPQSSKMTDQELHNNVFLFFLAGHETSSATLTMALYLLAQHPEIQRKARTEVLEVLGNTGDGDVQPSSLQNLQYCTAVLKETLRLFPPALAITPRVAPADVRLGGYLIPQGTTASISVLAIHRNPRHWPQPDVFDPQRFLGEEEAKRHAYAWMPFGAGPRTCIGMGFAWLEMRAALAAMLRNFEWSLDPAYELRFDRYITLRPKNLSLLARPIPQQQS